MTDTAVSGVLVLDRDVTRRALPPDELLAAVRTALVAISRGDASAPPRVAARSPYGLLGAMPGYVPRLGLAAKLVSVFPAGGHRGIVAYFDEEDGRPLAVMDAETITAVRTAATATVAMRALARPDARRIAVIGTGAQARAQIDLLTPAESAHLLVGARDRGKAERLGTAAGIEEAVKAADVVFCCTSSKEPVLHRSWLADGVHVSSVGGSDGPEFDAATLRASSLFVEWQGAVTEPPPAGAWELQGTDPADAALIGAVLDGTHPGRRSAGELTVFKSTGHAALDVAAASVAYRVARERGLGFSVDL